MRGFEFEVIIDAYTLADVPIAVSDALFEAGCDDATMASSRGVTSLMFHREADTMGDAIASAIRDVEAGLSTAGSPFRVIRVEPYDEMASDEDARAILRANAGLTSRHEASTG